MFEVDSMKVCAELGRVARASRRLPVLQWCVSCRYPRTQSRAVALLPLVRPPNTEHTQAPLEASDPISFCLSGIHSPSGKCAVPKFCPFGATPQSPGV